MLFSKIKQTKNHSFEKRIKFLYIILRWTQTYFIDFEPVILSPASSYDYSNITPYLA